VIEKARCPTVILTVVHVDFVRWVRCISPAAHDPHIVIVAAGQYEGKRSSLARSPWYAGNGRDGISYGVIYKRIVAIMDRTAVPSATSTGVDAIDDACCGYIAERNWQVCALLHPSVSSRSKFPNRVDHSSVDLETAQDVELVEEYCETAGQSYTVSVTRPGRGNGFDDIGNRVVTEHSVSSCGLSAR